MAGAGPAPGPSPGPSPGPAIGLVIAAGCLLTVLSFGIRAGFGLFLEPVSATYGWGREVFALALAIQNLIWGLGQPVAGAVADRYGTAKVLAGGAVVYAGGVALMAFAATPGLLYLSVGVMVGLGIAGASFALVLAAFAKLVPAERRSWVLGLGTAAGSFGQLSVVPVSQGLLDAFGWQTALLVLALIALVMLPCAAFLRARPGAHDATEPDPGSLGQALALAFGARSYVLLTAGFFVCGFHVAFIQVHFPAFIVDMGLSAALGAIALALVGGFNILGSYGAGVLGGRHSKRNLLSAIYLARAGVIAAFLLTPIGETTVILFSAAMGLLWLSTVPLTSGLVAVMFGTRYMGTLFGFVFLSHQLGAFLGAWIGGWAYDSMGSYDLAWWLGVGLGVLAALVHLPIRETAHPFARPAGA